MAEQQQFERRAVVLQDGHVDRISGPRCMVKMSEGPHTGLYLIARTKGLMKAETPVFYDEITRSARPIGEQPNG